MRRRCRLLERAWRTNQCKTGIPPTAPEVTAIDPKGEQTVFVWTTYIRETPERAWQGLTDPALTKRYWRHRTAGPKTLRSDWKKGSVYEMAHDVGLAVSGPGQVVLESRPPRQPACTWDAITPEQAAAASWAPRSFPGPPVMD